MEDLSASPRVTKQVSNMQPWALLTLICDLRMRQCSFLGVMHGSKSFQYWSQDSCEGQSVKYSPSILEVSLSQSLSSSTNPSLQQPEASAAACSWRGVNRYRFRIYSKRKKESSSLHVSVSPLALWRGKAFLGLRKLVYGPKKLQKKNSLNLTQTYSIFCIISDLKANLSWILQRHSRYIFLFTDFYFYNLTLN